MQAITLSSKGQLVVPAALRNAANWHAGMRLAARMVDGELRIRALASDANTATNLAALNAAVGCLAASDVPALTPEQLRNRMLKRRLQADAESTTA